MTALIFSHYEHKNAWINYQSSYSKQATLKWSTFAGCFSVAQWQSVQAVWDPNGSLTNLWMVVSGCTAL